ncbi:NAD(P)/FAD-dependent oxidoreductase [Flavobacterium sp.]|uniref:NAD(P)/FAD-dependent oxidoreductase n=1 Tax=Flavobacterium sp. TaxID=239 RepID=UPI00374CAA3C
MIDYLIVGSGIAGISFAEIALQNNKSILVFDNDSQNSSKIAGGIYNPVILKRFSEVWNAKQQIDFLNFFYPQIERRLDIKIDYKTPVLRKFFSVEEQNNWFVASDKPNLTPFLSTKILNKNYSGINAPFGFGEVMSTGYVDTNSLLQSYQHYLMENVLLIKSKFDYDQIEIKENCILYNQINAKHIIFAEGFGLHSNPYFNHLPLDGTKGELFIIKAANLNLDCILNSSVFILPIGNDLFKVGATYNWKDKTNATTEEGKQELLDRIHELLDCDFEIIEHFAGVRPTVRDRRPLVGSHHEHKNMYILNGLGTRGVMLGPSLAKALFETIENNIPLDTEIDIKRFNKRK